MLISEIIKRYQDSKQKINILNIDFIEIAPRLYMRESTIKELITNANNDFNYPIKLTTYEAMIEEKDKTYKLYPVWRKRELIFLQKLIEALENDYIHYFNQIIYDFKA